MSYEISNKIALVTGANRGIGRAIVESFIAHGAKKVYLAVRNPESTTELAKQYGDKVVTLKVDISDPDSIKALATAAQDVQLVVNNAGVLEVAGPFDEGVEQAFEKELSVNVFGLLRVAGAFAPILEKNADSAFVQLNSVASIKNFSAFTTYSASKAASYSITQSLKETWQDKGVQVLSVHPGPIATDMAVKGGMMEMADSASSVSEGIVAALKAGEFHLFPDAIAKNFESEYRQYATNVVEAVSEEG